MREFNKGINDLPQSNGGKYLYPLTAKLDDGETSTTSFNYYVFEIDNYDNEKYTYVVKRPTENSIGSHKLVIGPGLIEENEIFNASIKEPQWVAIDTTDGVPSIGDEVGTKAGSYKLFAGQTGFWVLDYISAAELALVRPMAGSGANLQVVQITGTPTDGQVNVKNVTLLGDPSASPNFSVSGDEYLATYYQD